MEIQPIGIVHSCYPDKFGTPRQPGLVPHSTGFIEISPQFQPKESLQGLETFSHLWVIFSFHLIHNYQFHAKVHPPLLEGQRQGVFATRTPHRPNTLGLSLVKINKITDTGIEVSELDIVDKTPVYDIKPYLPQFEMRTEALGGWPLNVERKNILITWSESAKKTMVDIQNQKPQVAWLSLIEETLSQDPRPLAFKREGLEHKQYRTNHYVRIHNIDVGFYFPQVVEPSAGIKELVIDHINVIN